jgi:oligoribonuclease
MYVFLDLETTGLDPKKGQILEVGILVLDDKLKEIDSFRQNVHFIPSGAARLRYDIPEKVFEMHTKSKLWDACANSYMDNQRVEEAALLFMEPYRGQEMCGSTIGFDRAWLTEHMPRLNGAFHYRSLDVSAFRVLFGKVGLETPPKKEVHRSLADCRESVDNLRYYMNVLGIGPVKDEDSGS